MLQLLPPAILLSAVITFLLIFPILAPITCTILSFLVFYPIFSRGLYLLLLKRKKADKWNGDCSSTNPKIVEMFQQGLVWGEENQAYKKDLHIVNDGLNLYGEYYDYGYDRAVIFVPGRTEGRKYGYYFVQQYPKAGFNVFLFDPRSHGKSDGTFNTLGFEEHKDLLAWANLLHEEYGVKSILFHGICIGSSASLMTLTSQNAPDYLDGLIAEGMYPTFYESLKNHISHDFKKPTWPLVAMVAGWMRHYTGHDMRYGNIHIIDKCNKPLLLLHSKEDLYSLPKDAQILFDKCPSEQKRLVWFAEGAHSLLRITDTERYTGAIDQFLKDYFPNETTAD